MDFSDGNHRLSGGFHFAQRLVDKPHLKITARPEIYVSRNTKLDAPYFNPSRDLSLVPGFDLVHILWRRYEHSFRQHVSGGAGTYWQATHGWPTLLNYLFSIVWAYLMCMGIVLWFVKEAGLPVLPLIPKFRLMHEWWGVVLSLTYLVQALVSVSVDHPFEKNLRRELFWVIWYPMFFWILQAGTAVAGLPQAIFRLRNPRGTWVSHDRGVT